MGVFLENYEIEKVCHELWEFIRKSDVLFSELEKKIEQKTVMDGDELYEIFSEIHVLCMRTMEQFDFIKYKLDSFLFFDNSRDAKRILSNYIDIHLQNSDCINQMFRSLNEICSELDSRGSFVNSDNIVNMIRWQRGYCRQYPSIKESSIALLDCLNELGKEIKQAEMVCVYAPPELMGKDVIINEMQDVYPSIHAHPVSEENDFEDSMIQLIYGSPEMINSDSKETKTKRNNFGIDLQFCLSCGQRITENMQLCNNCGKKIQRVVDPEITQRFCSSCGNSIPLISKFCPFCGKQMWKII